MKTVILGGFVVFFSLFSTGKCCFGCTTAATGRLVETTVTSIMKQDEIMELEKESFIVCDTDGDKGLSWEEVDNCEAKYGLFLDMESLDHLPNKEDFDTFDTDKDGILFFEEWENANE